MSYTIGSLFSGIGGLELGLEWAGLGPVVWQVEIDPFCRRVLAKHWPNATRFDDVTQIRAYPPVTVLCGGFPCQDVSSAGKRRGLGGRRSGLWYEFARVVSEVRPRVVVVENVASGARRWLPQVRRDLCALGYRTRAYALSAADVGAPHLRRRVFVVADAHGDDLRQQRRRGCGPSRRGAVLAARAGETRVASDAHSARREGTGADAHEGWSRSSAGAWGPSVGELVPVVHGLPGGVVGRRRRERIRALGNAVVPQCAEVIGRIVVELLRRPVAA